MVKSAKTTPTREGGAIFFFLNNQQKPIEKNIKPVTHKERERERPHTQHSQRLQKKNTCIYGYPQAYPLVKHVTHKRERAREITYTTFPMIIKKNRVDLDLDLD